MKYRIVVLGISLAALLCVDLGSSANASAAPGRADERRVFGFESNGERASLDSSEPRAVALTFDDGPDPEFTPRVLNVLRRERVPAAFFIVGSRAQAHPELVRRIFAEGHVLGNHTYTHVNLATAGPLRTRLELNATQRLIEALIGRRTVLFRPPYMCDPDAQMKRGREPIGQAGEQGYVTVAASIDSRDWFHRSADEIVQQCLQTRGQGGVILLHDGGGDRSATVRALPELIRRLRARGYRFVGLHDLIGRSRDEVMPVAPRTPWEGKLLALTIRGCASARHIPMLVAYLGLAMLLVRVLLVLPLAWRHRRRHQESPPARDFRPTVSVLVPAFNEGRVIGRTLEHLLASDYPGLEIVVIDDGSTDGTETVVASFLTDQRVRYLREENGGKGAALNTGIRESSGEIVVAMDADTLFERTTISRLVRRFADPRVGAVAGNIKVGNRRGLLTQWQSLEYVVGINLDKRCFDVLNCVTVVSGAVGGWRRTALKHVGGFSPETLAEDMDLTLSVRRAGYRIVFEPTAVAWTEAPATVASLAKQRLRWTFGTLQCLWKHRGAFLDPRAGALGMVAMPYMLLFQILLLLAGPLMDACLLGLCLLGHGGHAAVMAALFLAAEFLLTAIAFSFEPEAKWPLLLVPLQRLVYRQIIYWTALKATFYAVRGRYPGWQKLARTGTARVATTALPMLIGLLLVMPRGHAAGVPPLPEAPGAPGSAAAPDSRSSGAAEVVPEPTRNQASLPAALFDFSEFWDLVEGRGMVVGLQAGSYLQPVSDARGRGAAIRSGVSAVTAVSLDRVTTLAVERFDGETYRPDLESEAPLRSYWTGIKLTRRVAPGTTVSVLQLTGDGEATGLSLAHGRAWGPWEGSGWLWASSDTGEIGLDTMYAGFGASISRLLGGGLRMGAGLDGPLVRGQCAHLSLRYSPDPLTDATVAARYWYGKTLLELRAGRRVGGRWQVGALVSSQPTLSLFAKRRL
jgi:cellulose synthase/poly-beta-1,6-N-acetylglucosamine synthase-like glycosyltransferase/peptidoglycan/xylan/chitin deacetylase (PgdA/CDA1 family)